MIMNLGEIFSGPGGLAFDAKQASCDGIEIRHRWANDIDESACETYRRNICPGSSDSVINAPVQSLNIKKLKPIDALVFGFPCNDFSVVGEQKGFDGKFGPLYSYGVKILNVHKPIWFLAENVSGLQSANDGNAFKKILKDLEKAGNGYNITAHLYKFEEYGVPQTRHRIIIIGIDKSLNRIYKVPEPTTALNMISAREALEAPPIPDNASNHEYTKQSSAVIERLKFIPPGENAWYAGIPKRLRLNVKGAKLSQIYKRLHPDKPAYTITGSGGGGTHVYHWSEPRALTNRERARLQTFPDEFAFIGSKESVRRQIGMAVPPQAAKIIVTAVIKTLNGVTYNSVPAKWECNLES